MRFLFRFSNVVFVITCVTCFQCEEDRTKLWSHVVDERWLPMLNTDIQTDTQTYLVYSSDFISVQYTCTTYRIGQIMKWLMHEPGVDHSKTTVWVMRHLSPTEVVHDIITIMVNNGSLLVTPSSWWHYISVDARMHSASFRRLWRHVPVATLYCFGAKLKGRLYGRRLLNKRSGKYRKPISAVAGADGAATQHHRHGKF